MAVYMYVVQYTQTIKWERWHKKKTGEGYFKTSNEKIILWWQQSGQRSGRLMGPWRGEKGSQTDMIKGVRRGIGGVAWQLFAVFSRGPGFYSNAHMGVYNPQFSESSSNEINTLLWPPQTLHT